MKGLWPATYVALPPSCEGRRAAFYLAAEEYIAEKLPEGSYFFTWQVGPTVVMGHNQVAHQEVDLDFCRREGIDVIRRKSGGGAIFADERNIMTSLVTEDAPVEPLFHKYAEAVAKALRQLGAPAQISGRNDIVLEGGGKVCGNAFYKKTNRCIAHGTMLYDTTTRLMDGALHPNIGKLESKGVKSVRSRIGLLKDYLPFGVLELRTRLRNLLCDRTIVLCEEDVGRIEDIEQSYYDPQYLLGSTGRGNIVYYGHIEGCGQVELHFRIQGSLITNVELKGDYFELDDVKEAFTKAFVGRVFTPENLEQAIFEKHPESSIRNLSSASLLNILK